MSQPLTVACVWVNGHVPFTVEYVARLHAMCRRWIDRPFRFVCLTDRSEQLPSGIEAHEMAWGYLGVKGWWAKLAVFGHRFATTGRVLYLDLDTLIVGSLDEVIDFPAPFALIPDAGTFQGKGKLKVVKRFNSSVMVFDGGTLGELNWRWRTDVAQRLWGDQDWIGEQMPEAATMPLEWFPRISELQDRGPSLDAKVILCKKPKNLEAVKRWTWARQAWEAA